MNPIVLPELRYRRLWISVSVALLLAITVVCLLPMRDLPKVNLSDKIEHALAFAVLAFWFGGIVVRRDLGWMMLGLIAFGGAIEIAQGVMGWGRSADIKDLIADSFGVVMGTLASLTPLSRWARWAESLLARIGP